MVIQRLQSLLLLLAAALMGLMFLAPLGTTTEPVQVLTLVNWLPLAIVDIVIGVLLLIDIFLFKNLRLQMMVASISALMMCALAGLYTGVMCYNLDPSVQPTFGGASLMLLGAFVLTLIARRLMARDRNLLRSADRIR